MYDQAEPHAEPHVDFEAAYLRARVDQFRDQVTRRIDGSLTEEEFRPLRLMNGLYLQLHAYMLRVAIPYGSLTPDQLRKLAWISETWDRGYGHFTTRQNIQFNWPQLTDVPDMLEALAEVGMHAIQTSGATIRNVTADHFAGAAADEIEDPRLTAELIRQWSTDHPEFQFLPRKFKIAVTGAESDRAVTRVHDLGIRIVRNAQGETGYRIEIGGGLGRTPMIGQCLREFLPKADLLPYLEAVVSSYNLLGRRDNKYKARIKITLHEHGIDRVREMVEARFAVLRPVFAPVAEAQLAEIAAGFATPAFRDGDTAGYEAARAADPVFRAWSDVNLDAHWRADHAIVTISLKAPGETPGDATADQMRLIADLAACYGYGDIRVSHEQNIVLPHVHKPDLPVLFSALKPAGLATANAGLISDIIACPGMDYCSLATARSIPVAKEIAARFRALEAERDIGRIKIKISGCINACGHHHLGHIGILGLEKGGVESYQITLGGDGGPATAIGTRAGPGFAQDEIVPAVERLIDAYLALRAGEDETFIEAFRRLGAAPFKAALYPEVKTHAA
ncbi:MAG: nitrite/sulfite reductase [Paracoccaceae bacterium]